MREWIAAVGARTALIEPEAPGRTATARASIPSSRQLLNGEVFYSLAEATILIENRRQYYNTRRPHRASATSRGAARRAVAGCAALNHSRQGPPCITIRPGPPNGGRPIIRWKIGWGKNETNRFEG